MVARVVAPFQSPVLLPPSLRGLRFALFRPFFPCIQGGEGASANADNSSGSRAAAAVIDRAVESQHTSAPMEEVVVPQASSGEDDE